MTEPAFHGAASDESRAARPAADSVERALAVVGDSWTFLVLREAYFGVRRFEEIQRNLACSPNVLTGRLKKLVENGLLSREPYQDRPPRHEYRLTEKGSDLYPAIVLLMRWADRWLTEGKPPPLTLVHDMCGGTTRPILACDVCGYPVEARNVRWQPTRRRDP